MHCKYCGKELEENSKFCNHCGKALEEGMVRLKEKKDSNDKSGCGSALIVLLIIAGIIGLFFAIIKISMNVDSNGNIVDKIVERDLTRSDYSISTSEGLTSYTITITPNKKINSCNVQLTLYNSKGEIVYSDTITKNDLMKNTSYSYKFDFGFINALSGSKVSYKVTGKCVD